MGFFLLLPGTFCEIFVNFLNRYLSGAKINLHQNKKEERRLIAFSLLMKIEYGERKEILTVQHQDNLVILEMLHLGSPIRFLYKDEALMRECHF